MNVSRETHSERKYLDDIQAPKSEIHDQANQTMKKGDLLLEIDPAPYQYTVNQVEAQLAASKANVKQAEAALATANAAGKSVVHRQFECVEPLLDLHPVVKWVGTEPLSGALQ